jgi:ribosomal protein S18 acetylase RimI-like enzyme
MDELSGKDCARLAALHCECLQDSLVSELGLGYARAFYRYLSRSPEDKVFVLREGGEVFSGCVLCLRPRTLQRRLLLHTPLLFYAVPWFIRKACKKTPQPAAAAKPGAVIDPEPGRKPEVILIFTAPQARSRGTGAALLAQCEQFLLANKYPEYIVRTVDHESNRALGFYLRNGFTPVGQSSDHGRTFRVFRKGLASA